MLKDSRISIDALITFNPIDFIDICQAWQIEIVEN